MRALDPSQPLARVGTPAALPQPGWSRTWRAATQLATVALLLLTIVTGLVAFGAWQPGAPESPVSHLAAPNALPPVAATPAASPEALAPLAEVVAEIRLGSGPAHSPAGMAVDADGTLYVIDALQDQIRLFDPSGEPVATWGETGTEPGQFRFHGEGGFWGDLTLGPDGNLYVLDPFNSRIQVLRPDGTVVREWGEAGSEEGQFLEPVGLDIAPDGRVYVADTDNARVQIFDANGQFLEAWTASGDAQGLPSSPANIEVDAAGIVSVTDWNTNAIIRLDANGTVLDTLGTAEGAPGTIAGPWGMASDGQGNLFVADGPGNRIQVFAPDGTILGTIGGVGVQPGQFIIPKYVALSADGLLYVAEEGNRRIQVFRLLPPVWP
jgi:DNA-binding beta-propeller fold protein YncE